MAVVRTPGIAFSLSSSTSFIKPVWPMKGGVILSSDGLSNRESQRKNDIPKEEERHICV